MSRGLAVVPQEPVRDCHLCSRLAAFRQENRKANPDWFNAPVPAFGPLDAELLIVGLAPGLKGANLTGRPFTGDYAGDLLYATLLDFGFAEGVYDRHADDGLRLVNCRITNGVRCVPPQNKPIGEEINACRPFLTTEIEAMPNLRAVLSLGLVSHNTVLAALGEKRSAWKFSHGALHNLPGTLSLADSYHCSRYNTNTGRLTVPMFQDVFRAMRGFLD
jgi:uracil-DNA glycosylase family 4